MLKNILKSLVCSFLLIGIFFILGCVVDYHENGDQSQVVVEKFCLDSNYCWVKSLYMVAYPSFGKHAKYEYQNTGYSYKAHIVDIKVCLGDTLRLHYTGTEYILGEK